MHVFRCLFEANKKAHFVRLVSVKGGVKVEQVREGFKLHSLYQIQDYRSISLTGNTTYL